MKSSRAKSVFVLCLCFLAYCVFINSASTSFIKATQNFEGIEHSAGKNTNVLIVHGIGKQCIGYADSLIAGLAEKSRANYTSVAKRQSWDYYHHYEDERVSPSGNQKADINEANRQTDIYPFLKGNCKNVSPRHPLKPRIEHRLVGGSDSSAIVGSQEKLCLSLHKRYTDKSKAMTDSKKFGIDCYRLYVKSNATKELYTIGFVRIVEFFDDTSNANVRIYELTWSPAIRWVEDPLDELELVNRRDSKHILNRLVKKQVVNNSFSDAVAYLSDSGILVNFNIMQAFCLLFAKNMDGVEINHKFACDGEILEKGIEGFSADNLAYIITHSLGTRATLDTIGLLSTPYSADDPRYFSPGAYIDVANRSIVKKMSDIGAYVPDQYNSKEFQQILEGAITEFANSLQSIFAMTNQVPLLSANLTSPLDKSRAVSPVAIGFERFLKKRANKEKLQIVSFSDPDDLLSYNLACWYNKTILRHSEAASIAIENAATKKVVERESNSRTKEPNYRSIKAEMRRLYDILFVENCLPATIQPVPERKLMVDIQSNDDFGVSIIDASVRLKGLRMPWVAASPRAIHSNYFVDSQVQSWLVSGISKKY